ncbi:hypothetical protein NBRC10512_005484 [Rhodotorula toruloides]|uniref:F-box domain-containing protein n=1 Tax=Rhodotorula toruloides (strain NP11) TaxID=1130832 RepID=M7X5E8_RHOT1|nr:uncharacterized protein RHTO_05462 [Rhodotorula toruloides NP11]EMS18894.1 hypothetical protein RHTO_05462 [Rhodotorula toruloides NP11]
MESEGPERVQQTSPDSTPLSASPGADYLTSLPTELFLTICEFVHAQRAGPYLALISRRFLPFARRLVFDTVECRSIARIRCLHMALETCPELRIVVRRLVLGRSYSRVDDFGEDVPPIPILLACLDNHTTSVLPLLQRVDLHDCLDEEQRMHLVDTLGALQQYPHLHELSGVTRLTISGRLPFKPILGFARRSYKRLTCQTKTVTADELVTLLGYGRSTLGRLVLDISLLPIAPPPSVGVTFEGMSRVLEHAEVAGVQVEGKAVQEHRVEQRRRAMREVGTV